MALYPMGARPATAVKDTTGINPGNWTAALQPSDIQAKTDTFQCYHIYLRAPLNPTTSTVATVLLNQYYWDVTLVGQFNSWDPSQPMLMTPGDTLYVAFNVPVSITPAPFVTCWFRYEK